MDLNDEQKSAINYQGRNLVVTACPGSGKTRTLVGRAKHLLAKIKKGEKLALITYTNAASDEISHRLGNKKDVFVGTIHSFCLEYILRPYGWLYGWKKPRVVSYQEQIDFVESKTYFTERFIATDLGAIKKTLDGQFDKTIQLFNHVSSIDTIANDYHNYLDEIDAIDFGEILYRSYKIIIENEFVARYLANAFREILVDEFQDTDLFQYEILKAINSIEKCSFFFVGDSRQRIFGFAGAIQEAFSKAVEDFNAEEIELVRVYRSSNFIVDCYSKLFTNHPILFNESDNRSFDKQVEFKINNTLEEVVEELINTYKVEEKNIAILCQNWYDNFNISKKLRTSYTIVGIGSLPHRYREFNNSTMHLFRALAFNRFANSNYSRIILKRHIDTYCQENGINIDETNFLNFKLIELSSEFNSLELTSELSEGLNAVKGIFSSVFSKNPTIFDEIVPAIESRELIYWNFEKYIKVLVGNDGIFNDTYHKAKGLEFEAVILYAVDETKLPYYNPKFNPIPDEEQVEDSRKLLYVGLSRARKYLYVLSDANNPSRFIKDIT